MTKTIRDSQKAPPSKAERSGAELVYMAKQAEQIFNNKDTGPHRHPDSPEAQQDWDQLLEMIQHFRRGIFRQEVESWFELQRENVMFHSLKAFTSSFLESNFSQTVMKLLSNVGIFVLSCLFVFVLTGNVIRCWMFLPIPTLNLSSLSPSLWISTRMLNKVLLVWTEYECEARVFNG